MKYVLLLIAVSVLTSVRGTSQPKFIIELFNRVDKNQDGELTMDEFNTVFVNIDNTGNSDRKVNEQEMVTAWVDFFNLGDVMEGKLLFKYMDSNKNGAIEEDDVLVAFEKFDADGNAQVDLTEFLDEWQKITQQTV